MHCRGTALLQTQAASWLAGVAVAWFGLAHLSPLAILAAMGAFLIVIHLGFASATALASAMIPIIIAVWLQGYLERFLNKVLPDWLRNWENSAGVLRHLSSG